MKTWIDTEAFVGEINIDFFFAYIDMREGHYQCPISTRDLLYMFCGSPM